MAPLVFLEGQKLRKLTRVIRNQEVQAVMSTPFKSSSDMNKYLRDVDNNYHSTIKLLDDADVLKQNYKDEETRSSIAHDIYSYVKRAVNISLQAVRNYMLRTSYLQKIGAHTKDIFDALEALDPNNVTNVARLAKEARQYKESMKELMMKHQSSSSRNFSKVLKQKGTKFEDLIGSYKNERGFLGKFEDLKDEEKLLVYDDIIAASGRGSIIQNAFSTISGAAGIAVLVLALGIMVWDIFTSEHTYETITRDAMMTAATVGGAMVGDVLGAALPTLIGIEASPLILLGTSIIGSILGAYVIGDFVGWFLDWIFGSGGAYPLSTDGHICYVAPLPDGEAVAREIFHDQN